MELNKKWEFVLYVITTVLRVKRGIKKMLCIGGFAQFLTSGKRVNE